MSTQFKYACPAPRQVGGDDGYQWVVYLFGSPIVSGLTSGEASYYRLKFENEERAKRNEAPRVPPGPSRGTILRERGFEAAFERKTGKWLVSCSRCKPQVRAGKAAHVAGCRKERALYRRHPKLRWTVVDVVKGGVA